MHSLVVVEWGSQASHCNGFFFCGVQALGAWPLVAVVPGLAAMRHVESSWTRDRTHVP